jgi:hypothetical protein
MLYPLSYGRIEDVYEYSKSPATREVAGRPEARNARPISLASRLFRGDDNPLEP